jgi:hypothetical protein
MLLGLMMTLGAGKSKVVNHPDPLATTAVTWQEWRIPLSEFTSAGVKMATVKELTIGVGNRANPQTDGTGPGCFYLPAWVSSSMTHRQPP